MVACPEPPTTHTLSSSGTRSDSIIISDSEEIGDGESSDRENIDNSQRASDIRDGIVNETTGAGPSCLPTPTSARKSKQQHLENALLDALRGLNFKQMYAHMGDEKEPTIRLPGFVNVPPPSEIWRQVEELTKAFASHVPNESLKRRPRGRKNSANTSGQPKTHPANTPKQHKMPCANQPGLLDRHQKIMAAILTRFRNMVAAASEPISTTASIPQASLNLMTMNNEAAALVCHIL